MSTWLPSFEFFSMKPYSVNSLTFECAPYFKNNSSPAFREIEGEKKVGIGVFNVARSEEDTWFTKSTTGQSVKLSGSDAEEQSR